MFLNLLLRYRILTVFIFILADYYNGDMKKTIILKLKKIRALLFLIVPPFFAFSQTNITTNTSATSLAQTIVGNGVTVSAAHFNKCGGVPTGSVVSAGTFTNVSGDLGIANGVILTTGAATDAGLSHSVLASKQLGYNYTDPDLVTISSSAIYDVCSLSFTFTPICSSLNITFVFASEEWPTHICGTGASAYNDAFGLFLSGPNPAGGNYVAKNVAVLPNASSTPVQIDSINDNYNNLCGKPENVAYFVNNTTSGQHYTDIVYDGFTTPITSITSVVPCSTYVMEIAIGEATNGKYDSGVFIKGGSVNCTAAPVITSSTTPANCGNNDGTATINISNYSGTPTYSWSTNGQTTSSITGLGIGSYTCLVSLPGCSTTYTQSLIATVASGSVTIPNVIITPSSTTTCQNQPITLTASGATTYTWNNGATTQSIIVNSNGTYSVTGTTAACSNTAVTTVSVIAVAASFSASPNIGTSPLNVALTNGSVGASTYSWNFGNGVTSIAQNPATTYQNAGTYTVTLTATQGLCNEVYSQIIIVSEQLSTLIIPNIFTPNGDGVNEVFTITGTSIATYNCVIYDRWGLEMFESNQIATSWNGKNKSGNEAPDGIYYYIINAKGLDLKNYTYKGFVTLTR